MTDALRSARALLAASVLSCFAAPATAQDSAEPGPVLAPAVGIAGTYPGTSPDSPFGNPIVGDPVVCGGVERRIAVLNPSIVCGEPLLLRLIMRDVSDAPEPPNFMARLAFRADFDVIVQPPGRIPPYLYEADRTGATGPTAVLRLDNRIHRADVIMAMDLNSVSGAAFDLPGEWRLTVMLRCVSGDDPANEQMQTLGNFTINVREAMGDDRLALDLLNTPEAWLPVQLGISRLASGRTYVTPALAQSYERLIERAPKAAVRPHLMLLVAAEHVEAREFNKALELYKQIEKEYPRTPFFDRAQAARLRVYAQRGDRSAEEALFRELWQNPVAVTQISPRMPVYRDYAAPFLAETGTQWMLFEGPSQDPINAGSAYGPRIILSEELRRGTDLPEFLTPEELSQIPLSAFGAGAAAAPSGEPSFFAPPPGTTQR